MRDKFIEFVSWAGLIIGLAFVLMVNTSQIDAGGQFIDLNRWKSLTYWTQLVSNTIFLVMVYSTFLYKRKDALMVDNEDIEKEYKELFEKKDKIINDKQKDIFEHYLKLVVNLIERLELHRYKLNMSIKKLDKKRSKTKYERIRVISDKIDEVDKYIAALRDANINELNKSQLDINSIYVKQDEINFDTIFNLVDYETNKPISVGYSDTKEARKLVSKSPFSAFGTMFISILAFGNVLVASDDLRSIALIMLAVIFGAIFKIQQAYKHAERIAKNKRRALRKTNDMIKVFFTYDNHNLELIKNAVYNIGEEKPKIVKKTVEDDGKMEMPPSLRKMPDKEPELESDKKPPLEACKRLIATT
jgi:hypothetical protein